MASKSYAALSEVRETIIAVCAENADPEWDGDGTEHALVVAWNKACEVAGVGFPEPITDDDLVGA